MDQSEKLGFIMSDGRPVKEGQCYKLHKILHNLH